MPVENGGALDRAASQPKRVQSWPGVAAGAPPAQAATARIALAKPIQRAVERGRIELTVPVFSERGEIVDAPCDRGRREPPVSRLEAPDRAAAVVPVVVPPARRRHGRAAVDV